MPVISDDIDDLFFKEFEDAKLYDNTIEVVEYNNFYNITIIGKTFPTYDRTAGNYYKQMKEAIERVLNSKDFSNYYSLHGTIIDNKVISNYSEKFILSIKYQPK